MNSKNRIAVTPYSLGTVCLKDISINTVHKGDDDNDDDDDDNNNNNNNNSNNNVFKTFMSLYESSLHIHSSRGYLVAQLVEALRYKPEGRGFNSRLCHWHFSLP